MGIYANVEVVDYDFDQPFRDIAEAVAFWKNHMGLTGGEHDETLREFLSGRLERSGDLLWARVPKRSAVLLVGQNLLLPCLHSERHMAFLLDLSHLVEHLRDV